MSHNLWVLIICKTSLVSSTDSVQKNLDNPCYDGEFQIDDCPLRNSNFLNQKILKYKIENLTDKKPQTKTLFFEKFTTKTIRKLFDLLYGISFEVKVKSSSAPVVQGDSEMTL